MQRVAAVLKCWKGLEKLRFAFCLLQLVQLHNKKQSRTATHSSRRLDRVSCPAFSLQCSSQCELNGQSRAASPRSLTWWLCETFRFFLIITENVCKIKNYSISDFSASIKNPHKMLNENKNENDETLTSCNWTKFSNENVSNSCTILCVWPQWIRLLNFSSVCFVLSRAAETRSTPFNLRGSESLESSLVIEVKVCICSTQSRLYDYLLWVVTMAHTQYRSKSLWNFLVDFVSRARWLTEDCWLNRQCCVS